MTKVEGKKVANKAPKVTEEVVTEKVNNKTVEELVQEVKEEMVEPVEEVKEEVKPVEEKTVEEVFTEPIPEPTIEEKPIAGIDAKKGECYLVKSNPYLLDRLSKYSVRLRTENGYKEIMKTGREKAFLVANELNKNKGITAKLKVYGE